MALGEVVTATREFVRAANATQEAIAKNAGLVVSDLHALGILMEADDALSQAELADRVNLQPGSVTSLVKRLLDQGLVGRKRNARDVRKYVIYLTEHGLDVYAAASREFESAVSRVAGSLSDRNQAVIVRYLRGMVQESKSGGNV